MILKELFNGTKHEYEIDDSDDKTWFASATLDNGDEFTFEAMSFPNGFWVVDFEVNGKFVATNNGNQFEVFPLVMEIMEEFIKSKNPNSITMTSEPISNRARLYLRMAKRFATNDKRVVSLDFPVGGYKCIAIVGDEAFTNPTVVKRGGVDFRGFKFGGVDFIGMSADGDMTPFFKNNKDVLLDTFPELKEFFNL